MRLRSIIALTFIIILMALSFLFFSGRSNKDDSSIVAGSIIELTPFPTVVSNEQGQKDNRLYDLLINKSDQFISIKNVDMHFDSMSMLPFDLKNLFMHFCYDKENDRVNFNGNSLGKGAIKIVGYYGITNKNNIKYNIIISSASEFLEINALYNPSESDNLSDGGVVGNFTFKSVYALQFLDSFKTPNLNRAEAAKYDALLGGEFTFKERKFTVSNLNINSKDANLDINFEFTENAKLKIKADIKNLDTDSFFSEVEAKKIVNYLSYNISNIMNFEIDAEVKADKITYNKIDLHALTLNVECGNKECKVKNLDFTLPDNSNFNTHGIITKNKFRSVYKGNLLLKNAGSRDLMDLLGIPKTDDVNSKVSLSSGIMLSKSLLLLDNLEVKENDTILSTNLLKFLFHDKDTYLLDANIKIDKFNQNSYLIRSLIEKNNFFHNLVDSNYSKSIQKYKNSNHTVNLGLHFTNVTYGNKKIDNIYLKYTASPNFFALEDISSDEDNLKMQGGLKINLEGDKPYIDLVFNGDKVDMKLFNDIIGERFYTFHRDVDEKKETIHKFSLFRFDQFDGKINLNIKGNEAELVSAIKCQALLKDGDLSLDSCAVGAFGGSINIEKGVVKLGKELSYEIEYDFGGAEIEKIIKFLKNTAHKTLPLEGKGKINLRGNENSHGNSIEAIASNAEGKFRLKSVTEATLSNVNVTSIVSTYGNPVFKSKGATGNKKSIASRTIFKEAAGNFIVNKGNIKSEDFYFITKDNIHGKLNFHYNFLKENTNGVLSLVYLARNQKVDGFNLSFSGKINDLKTKLGTE